MSTLGTRFCAIPLFAALLGLSVPVRAGDQPETFKCSARGGPEWREYRSKHFLLTTDLSRDSAALLIKDLEQFHVLVLQAMVGEQVDIPGRARVIAFSDPGQFHESAHANIGGYFTMTGLKQPIIVMPVAGFQARPETVAHELVHYLSWFLFPRQPRWFSEGLAQFIETIASELAENEPATALGSHIVRGATHLRGGVGVIPRKYSYALREVPPVPVKDLLSWRGFNDVAEGPYYVQSWLLFHWLWNNRSKQFTEFQRRLSAAEDPYVSWRASFPEFDPLKPAALEGLDKTLDAYRRSARYAFYRVQGGTDPAFTESKLPPAEVHVVLADLRMVGAKSDVREALLRAELDEAIREDPTNPIAIARRARLEQNAPLEDLRKSVAARPNDARAWLFLGRTLTETGNQAEAERAYRKAIALDPDSAAAHNSLAALLTANARNKEAVSFANRAVDLAPWDPSCVDTLASVAAGLGKCSEALILQRRAISLVDANASSISLAGIADDNAYTKRLREYEARCAPSASK